MNRTKETKKIPYKNWNNYVTDKTLDKSLECIQFWRGDIMITAQFSREKAQELVDSGKAGFITPQAIGVY